MSGLRSIEMQVALPRTQTAGKLQDQLQQRAALMQNQLSQKQLEENDRIKRTVSHLEKSEKKRLNNDDEQSRGQGKRMFKNNGKEISIKEDTDAHPFKGKSLDIKG
ncbi:hypothetical protein ACERII_12180 [Evansella sp. AB-rgal1]|uniref:hypothetical protein n=1 Tax=Evansella sp. AB-rgal1 TaxID=3242696 RepID=UPI00359DC063